MLVLLGSKIHRGGKFFKVSSFKALLVWEAYYAFMYCFQEYLIEFTALNLSQDCNYFGGVLFDDSSAIDVPTITLLPRFCSAWLSLTEKEHL